MRMSGERPPEAWQPEFGEMQHSLERTAYLDSLLAATTRLGDAMGVDLRTILPSHQQFRYYPNHDAMNAGLVAAGSRPVPEGNNAVCVGGERGMFIREGTGPNDTNSTSAHELAHQLGNFLWGYRSTQLEQELNAEMFGAVVTHLMGPDARGSFQPSYGGLGIIGDEIIRHLAAKRGITGLAAYLEYGKDMFARFGSGRTLLEEVLGEERANWFVNLDHRNRGPAFWAAVARHLGLPDAVRRLTVDSMRGLNIMQWLHRDEVPARPQPLGTQIGDERLPSDYIAGGPEKPNPPEGPGSRQAVDERRATPRPPSTDTGGGGPNTHLASGAGGGRGARTGGGVSVGEIKAAIDLAKQQMEEALGAIAVAREKLEEGKQSLGAALDGSGSDLVGSAYASLAEADQKAEEAFGSVMFADENATTFQAIL
jgi:hypothetical protein